MENQIQLLAKYQLKVDELILPIETNEEILMLAAAMLQRTIDIYDAMIGVEQRNDILNQIIDGKMAPQDNEEIVPPAAE